MSFGVMRSAMKMPHQMKAVVLLAGPTASGKSDLAVQLAKQADGEVINADALQVYRDLRVISARPTQDDMDGIAHHLFGHIDGGHRYSAGQWLKESSAVILDILARGKLPIVVGGTGLYFKALIEGLAEVPPADTGPANLYLNRHGIAALRELAVTLDPIATARVLGDDPQRLLRIVSVAQETAKPLSVWQSATTPVIPRGYWTASVLLPPRQLLYERINQRFDVMVEQGGLLEVEALAARGLASDLPVMRAIGAKTIIAHLKGECALDVGIELAKRDTRRFAKRQMTWFRGQAADWPVIANKADKARFLGQFQESQQR